MKRLRRRRHGWSVHALRSMRSSERDGLRRVGRRCSARSRAPRTDRVACPTYPCPLDRDRDLSLRLSRLLRPAGPDVLTTRVHPRRSRAVSSGSVRRQALIVYVRLVPRDWELPFRCRPLPTAGRRSPSSTARSRTSTHPRLRAHYWACGVVVGGGPARPSRRPNRCIALALEARDRRDAPPPHSAADVTPWCNAAPATSREGVTVHTVVQTQACSSTRPAPVCGIAFCLRHRSRGRLRLLNPPGCARSTTSALACGARRARGVAACSSH